MLAFVIRRVIIGAAMLIAMSLVTFLLFFASPIDPAQYACGKNCSPQLKEQVTKALGYDKPAVVQWTDFLKGIVAGRDYPDDPELRKSAPELVAHCSAPCFGYSATTYKTVNQEIKEGLPTSVSVGIAAVLIWLGVAILVGVIAALKQGTIIDRSIVGISLIIYAFPVFFTGTFLLRFVAIKWRLYPVPAYHPISDGFFQWLINLLLPALTLAGLYMAGYARITRAFVLESMTEDYVRTARAKGVKGRSLLFKHSLRAALTPLVTMTGIDLAQVLGGAIITETVFGYHGLGKLAVQAQQNYDLPTLIGLVVLLGAFVIIANVIVDILYAYIDPRVRVR